MRTIRYAALAFAAAIALPAHAVMTPESQREIEHLIDHVGSSGCDFYRNGTWYSGQKGKSHLQDKYNYAKKQGLSTVEEFVDNVASSSSLSDEPYKVRCNGTEATASVFLNAELQRYRAAASAPSMASLVPDSIPVAAPSAASTPSASSASSSPSPQKASGSDASVRTSAPKAVERRPSAGKTDRN